MPSGAAGLAGHRTVLADPALSARFALDRANIVPLIATDTERG
jgi:hypothetical protein